MAPHLDAALSAYADEALTPDERASVEAHLGACEACRAELDELRAVQRLLAALPERAPRRSLLPRRSALPGWLVPARWASSAAAVVFAFAFVVSSVPAGLALPTSGGAPAAAPAPGAERNSEDAFKTQLSASPPAAGGPTNAAGAAAERPTAVPRGSASSDRTFSIQDQPPAVPVSWLWLTGAVVAGLATLGLQWRIARRR